MMFGSRRVLQAAVLVGLLAMGIAAQAATVRALSLDGLTEIADVVVMGEAVEVRTHRDQRGRVVRSVLFQVDEYVVGSGPERISIRLMGGVLEGQGRHVPGEIVLNKGARTLLFAERISSEVAGVFFVVGMAQGRFHIVADDMTGQLFVSRTLGDLHLVGDPGEDSLGLGKNCTSVFIPLDTFLSSVRDHTEHTGLGN